MEKTFITIDGKNYFDNELVEIGGFYLRNIDNQYFLKNEVDEKLKEKYKEYQEEIVNLIKTHSLSFNGSNTGPQSSFSKSISPETPSLNFNSIL